MAPLTITTANMTDTEVDRAIEDAKSADQDIFIRDENCKVFTDNKPHPSTFEDILENSDLELASNTSSSTEIETEEKEPIRRSKRLTKTNPIVRYNNPICHDYRSHRRKAELGSPHRVKWKMNRRGKTTASKPVTRQNTNVTDSQSP